MKTCEMTVYTTAAVLNFSIAVTIDNFKETLAEMLEDGTVVLDTADGTMLILNAINVVAIELNDA